MTFGKIGARNMLLRPRSYWGLCFTAEEPGVVVNMSKSGSPPAVTLETSRDGVVWEPFDADNGTTPVTLAKAGDYVYFRAGPGGNVAMSSSYSDYRRFTLSARCAARGNIMSLFSATDSNIGFSAPYAALRLFYGCTSLTTAPKLPATTLTSGCYIAMFQGCTSLATAPALPATSPLVSSYNSMFRQCASLREVEVAFTSFPSTGFNLWLHQVSSTGTFRCPTALGTNESIRRGFSNCPEGWTVVNTD